MVNLEQKTWHVLFECGSAKERVVMKKPLLADMDKNMKTQKVQSTILDLEISDPC